MHLGFILKSNGLLNLIQGIPLPDQLQFPRAKPEMLAGFAESTQLIYYGWFSKGCAAMKLEHYVYEVLVDGDVRYIGMGTRDRVSVHVRLAKAIIRNPNAANVLNVHIHLALAIQSGAQVSHRIISSGLSRSEAQQYEREAIASRSDTLWNVHSGGGGIDAESMTRLWRDPAWRSKQVALLKAKWEDPEYRKRMHLIRSDPEFRRAVSAAVTSRFSSQDERQKQSERTTKHFAANPERRSQHSSIIKRKWAENRHDYSRAVAAHWSDPSHRKRQSDAAKSQWRNEDTRKSLMAAAKSKWTPELRKKRSELTRLQFQDPKQRRLLGEATKARYTDPEYRRRVGAAIKAGKARNKALREAGSLPKVPPQKTID